MYSVEVPSNCMSGNHSSTIHHLGYFIQNIGQPYTAPHTPPTRLKISVHLAVYAEQILPIIFHIHCDLSVLVTCTIPDIPTHQNTLISDYSCQSNAR